MQIRTWKFKRKAVVFLVHYIFDFDRRKHDISRKDTHSKEKLNWMHKCLLEWDDTKRGTYGIQSCDRTVVRKICDLLVSNGYEERDYVDGHQM